MTKMLCGHFWANLKHTIQKEKVSLKALSAIQGYPVKVKYYIKLSTPLE